MLVGLKSIFKFNKERSFDWTLFTVISSLKLRRNSGACLKILLDQNYVAIDALSLGVSGEGSKTSTNTGSSMYIVCPARTCVKVDRKEKGWF